MEPAAGVRPGRAAGRRLRPPRRGACRFRAGRLGAARPAARARAVSLYLDSSALVKLVQVEAESASLRRYLRRHRSDERVSSALARGEVLRAVLAGGPPAVGKAGGHRARSSRVPLAGARLEAAAPPPPGRIRRGSAAITL